MLTPGVSGAHDAGGMRDTAETEQQDRTDGRRAWRDRNLSAVVDALLDLFAEGNLRPGADEIASRSGVSRRSVFRYFQDLDALDRVAIERHTGRVGHLFELDALAEGPLAERIERLVAQRMRLYEAIAPVARVSRLRAPFEPVLEENLQRSQRLLRRQIERHFERELDAMERTQNSATVNAAAALCSYEAYDLMRRGYGTPARQIAETFRRGLEALFG
jgi:AcrR family transcriptional regulator